MLEFADPSHVVVGWTAVGPTPWLDVVEARVEESLKSGAWAPEVPAACSRQAAAGLLSSARKELGHPLESSQGLVVAGAMP